VYEVRGGCSGCVDICGGCVYKIVYKIRGDICCGRIEGGNETEKGEMEST